VDGSVDGKGGRTGRGGKTERGTRRDFSGFSEPAACGQCGKGRGEQDYGFCLLYKKKKPKAAFSLGSSTECFEGADFGGAVVPNEFAAEFCAATSAPSKRVGWPGPAGDANKGGRRGLPQADHARGRGLGKKKTSGRESRQKSRNGNSGIRGRGRKIRRAGAGARRVLIRGSGGGAGLVDGLRAASEEDLDFASGQRRTTRKRLKKLRKDLSRK